MAFTFLPSSNYPGSSGIGAWAPTGGSGGGGGGTSNKDQAMSGLQDYAIYDASSGQYIHRNTRQPFNGTDPRTGTNYANGKVASLAGGGEIPPAPTGDVSKDYQAVNISKNPALSGEVDTMLKSFKDAADSALQDFSKYKTQFNSDIGTARQAAAQAADITPTVNALTQANHGYVDNLNQSQRQYQQALQNTAQAQRGVVGQELSNLGKYDTAVNNVRDQELAALGPQMARYKLASGTPTSGGSAEMSILANQTAKISAPMELQKIQENQRILANQALPVEQNIGSQAVQYAGSYLPQVAGAQYGAQTNLANTVQTLKQQVANMDQSNAVSFMQAMGVPAAVQAQVMGTQMNQLGQIASLYPAAYYQGLNYLPGAQVTPTVGYSNSLPGYPDFGTPRGGARQSGMAQAPQPRLGNNSPQEVSTNPGYPSSNDMVAPSGPPANQGDVWNPSLGIYEQSGGAYAY